MPQLEPTEVLIPNTGVLRLPLSSTIGMQNRRRLKGLFLFLAALALILFRPLLELIRFALSTQHYSHILMVPFISGYIVRQRRSNLMTPFYSSIALASISAIIGVVALWIGFAPGVGTSSINNHESFVALALLSFFLTGCFIFLGFDVIKQLAFPISFLIFAVPMPDRLLEAIETFLQYASADAAAVMLWISQVPVLRDGLQFKMPGITIRVAQECSGFNSTFVLFMVSLVAGNLFLRSAWRKTVFALFVLPLAIARNGFRITTIALLCVHVDPKMIDSQIHHQGGPVFFALSMIPFGIFLWYLRKTEDEKNHDKSQLNVI